MKKRHKRALSGMLWALVIFVVTLAATDCREEVPPFGTPVYRYEVVNAYPHDSGAFTQGLVYHNGYLYESTGRRGLSSLRQVELETGNVLKLREVASEYFAEGLALCANRLYQITWTSGRGFVYDVESFALLDDFTYPGEGWGLTCDGARLIMSDGTNTLRFIDPDTFEETGRVEVFDDGRPVGQLNELEYIDGQVYANVYREDRIAIIEPETGQVAAWADFTGLLTPAEQIQGAGVFNGIAWDPEKSRLFVTGKLWPSLYEVRLVETSDRR